MFTNKCIKCGSEFQTKNPKRVICPNCLYPDRKSVDTAINSISNENNTSESTVGSYQINNTEVRQSYNSYSTTSQDRRQNTGSYSSYNRGYSRNTSSYSSDRYSGNRSQQRSYDDRNNRYHRESRDNRDGVRPLRYNNQNYRDGGYKNKPTGTRSFNNPRKTFNRPPQRKMNKQLLISKEELLEIEKLYKPYLPLPNQDVHETIAEKLNIEQRKVFFGINLIRQKLMLPKLAFPKRKLAVTPDQLFAIKNLYEPLLPLPPIKCHKIIAAQLKMDEWRVHVGIGVIRRQLGLDKWNENRPDWIHTPSSSSSQQIQTPIEEEKTIEEKDSNNSIIQESPSNVISQDSIEQNTNNDNLDKEVNLSDKSVIEEEPKKEESTEENVIVPKKRGRKPKKVEITEDEK